MAKTQSKGAESAAPADSEPLRVLVDADSICYAAGFAAQHEFYLATNRENKRILAVEQSRSDVADVIDAMDLSLEDVHVWTRREVEPVQNAIHSLKLQIERSVKCVREAAEAKGRKVGDVRVFLTGSGNFRERIATIRPYKGNRDPENKPVLLPDLRAYLVERWGAVVVQGREADDEVAIEQTQYTEQYGPSASIIVGIDKDLWQIPGLHYNPHLDKFANITPAQGDCLFYRQVLVGDASDNVKGCHKIGPKKAAEAIKPDMSCEEMASVCLELFTLSIQLHGDVYNGLDAEAALLETGRLLWLRRKPDDDWRIGKGARNP